MITLKHIGFVVLLLVTVAAVGQKQLVNPLLPAGADPWVIHKDGYYYYTHTTGRNLVLYRVRNLSELSTAKGTVIWQPPAGQPWSKDIWAPELHFIKDRWYFYFAADDGANRNHRIYVLENRSKDPMRGSWVWKGKVGDRTDKWAIDGSVFDHEGSWYMIWSGWDGDANGQQDLYIAKMKNPWTLSGKRVRISSPTLDWERFGDLNDPDNPPHVSVNEGPQLLRKGKKLFIVYSASGCWTDHYGLGMLTYTGKGSLLDSAAWQKSQEPVFATNDADSVYAPGHNSFFQSPDGREDWILYHANSAPGQGCGRLRSPRAQPFTWDAAGRPQFGKPLRSGMLLPAPSEKEPRRKHSL